MAQVAFLLFRSSLLSLFCSLSTLTVEYIFESINGERVLSLLRNSEDFQVEFFIANKRNNLTILHRKGRVIRFETFSDRQLNCGEILSVYVVDCCTVKDSLCSTSEDEDFCRVYRGHQMGSSRNKARLARYFNKLPFCICTVNKSVCVKELNTVVKVRAFVCHCTTSVNVQVFA